jgi:hypothetical protein
MSRHVVVFRATAFGPNRTRTTNGQAGRVLGSGDATLAEQGPADGAAANAGTGTIARLLLACSDVSAAVSAGVARLAHRQALPAAIGERRRILPTALVDVELVEEHSLESTGDRLPLPSQKGRVSRAPAASWFPQNATGRASVRGRGELPDPSSTRRGTRSASERSSSRPRRARRTQG